MILGIKIMFIAIIMSIKIFSQFSPSPFNPINWQSSELPSAKCVSEADDIVRIDSMAQGGLSCEKIKDFLLYKEETKTCQ